MLLLPLYIDPGTGSMLFSLFIGIAAAASFGLRALFLKLKFIFSGGKVAVPEGTKTIPFVIFSDHKRYWNVFKPVCDEFEKRGISVVFYTASPDDPALTTPYEHIKAEYLGEKNKPYAKLNFLQADILLATTPGLGVYQWKRSKNVACYVHIPHSISDFAGYRMFGLDHYDCVIASGENQRVSLRKLEQLRPATKEKEFVAVGSTYLDSMKARLDAEGRAAPNRKNVVLVAPTWGKSGILSRFGEKLLAALSQTDFDIIVRPHPQSVVSEQTLLRSLEEQFPDITWNYDNDNFAVLNQADIMITDFSGVIFDYALIFDKPVIYADTHFDSAPYDADWLSEPLWEFTVLEKIGIPLKEEQFSDISAVVSAAIASERLQQGRDTVRAEAWANQGGAAVSAVDFLLEKQRQVAKDRL